MVQLGAFALQIAQKAVYIRRLFGVAARCGFARFAFAQPQRFAKLVQQRLLALAVGKFIHLVINGGNPALTKLIGSIGFVFGQLYALERGGDIVAAGTLQLPQQHAVGVGGQLGFVACAVKHNVRIIPIAAQIPLGAKSRLNGVGQPSLPARYLIGGFSRAGVFFDV